MKKIGIIGKGFVGTAVAQGFSPHSGYESEVKIFDKDPTRTINTLDEVVNDSKFVFISVPTPSNEDGSIKSGSLLNMKPFMRKEDIKEILDYLKSE